MKNILDRFIDKLKRKFRLRMGENTDDYLYVCDDINQIEKEIENENNKLKT